MIPAFLKGITIVHLYVLLLLSTHASSAEMVEVDANNKNTLDPYHCTVTSNHKLSSLCIDENLQYLKQDNPDLIQLIRENYIYPPSTLPYNFSMEYKSYDDELLAGQFHQASFIERKYFEVNTYKSDINKKE